MSLDITKLRSPEDIQNSGNFIVYDSGADTLATVMAASYFDDAFNHLRVDDTVRVTHPSGVTNLEVLSITAGVVVMVAPGGVVEALPGGGGTANVTDLITEVTSTGADVIVVPDGLYIGHRKMVTCIVDGGSVIVTPTTTTGAWATVTLLSVADNTTLVWDGSGWLVEAVGGGLILLPVIG
jgi:hypothetical protein